MIMKTAISIPDPLFERVEQLAHELHISRSELFARAVSALVAKYDEAEMRRALDVVYSTESSALPPGAAAAQAEILAEWDDS